jgi:hypothetical protein
VTQVTCATQGVGVNRDFSNHIFVIAGAHGLLNYSGAYYVYNTDFNKTVSLFR